ncbi:MAG: hypothetical protein JEZ14_26125, partial [Marinilabiliaceae bacterium]|nr:hypothetical protein [Marinilabiliaceae bacterium]
MEKQKQTIDNLMDALFDYMRHIHRSEGTILRYCRRWQKVKVFMLNNDVKYYDANVEKAYLTSVLGEFDYHQLNRKEKDLVNVIEVLTEFQKTGRVLMGPRKRKPKVFKGEIGCIITDFINHRGSVLKLSNSTIQSYIFHLYPFSCYMHHKGVKQISNIKPSDILSYIEQMNPNTSANKHVSLTQLEKNVPINGKKVSFFNEFLGLS